jgi:precorrin-2 methylase/DMSO/TMAO reductase YedYZ molybdopterin-dependent catalytic subunit
MIRSALLLCSLAVWLLACGPALAMVKPAPASQPALTVTGEVKRPLKLTVEDLARFQSVEVQLNEVHRDSSFHGVFRHQAVPLRHLLDMAQIVKQDSPFPKQIDLAIRVRNAAGEQVLLSWGEVFYSNAGEVAIAFAATPVKPMMTVAKCQSCHGPEVFQSALDVYARSAKLPKLLIRSDFYTDRCLENVTGIEVIDLYPDIKIDRSVKLQSDELLISGAVEKELKVCCLKKYPQIEVSKKVVGMHMGYHGLHNYVGTPLVKLLEAAGAGNDLTKGVMISAPDGYRAFFSFGELHLADKGRRIILAKSDNGKLLKGQRGGKFRIIVPDELVDDRDVLAVDRIEVVDLKPAAKISVIGVGPGDTDLITLEAISALARADVLVAPDDIVKRFAAYLDDKPNLFDPLQLITHMFRKAHPDLDPAEAEKRCNAERAAGVAKIRQALDEGKNVAFLDWGDPLIYGSSRWIRAFFSDEQLETVPAMSSLNAANAMIQRDIGAGGSIAVTMPSGLRENPGLLKAVADSGDTLVIFMGLKEFVEMKDLFDRYYAADTPVALVYNAGIAGSERLVRTTLQEAVGELEAAPEQFLGLIYMGPRLNQRFGGCR